MMACGFPRGSEHMALLVFVIAQKERRCGVTSVVSFLRSFTPQKIRKTSSSGIGTGQMSTKRLSKKFNEKSICPEALWCV